MFFFPSNDLFLYIFITKLFFLYFSLFLWSFFSRCCVCHQNIFSYILPNNKINFAVCCYLCISAFRTCCITVIILIYAIHFIPTRNLMKSSVMWWWYITKICFVSLCCVRWIQSFCSAAVFLTLYTDSLLLSV